MCLLNTINAFKGFLGALLGGHHTHDRGPAQGAGQKPGHTHLSYTSASRPTFGHAVPQRPGHGHNHPYPVCEFPQPDRPVRPLASLG
ncbi:hypothetical protein ATI14_2800 [Pseudomonas tolaasii NCPPB 2192]|uniref:Secreted protein n=1 Tax=Pseudomonas tolaasii NCPPB 2192 TaxID=564423 RepID=A0ABX4QGF1_PSETO|nr:hypothetical protein ATI14_2800 [Pseudomonas tolaasii NCPPB 2192]